MDQGKICNCINRTQGHADTVELHMNTGSDLCMEKHVVFVAKPTNLQMYADAYQKLAEYDDPSFSPLLMYKVQ